MGSQPLHVALPPELWDDIIDELSSNFPTLRACALTQRAWVPRTRRYLFKAVSLKGVDRCRAFQYIIHSSSSTGTGVAQCVRDVTLTEVRLHLDVPEDPVASDVPLLEEVLSALPNVNCLRLVGVDVKCRPKMHTGDALDDEYPDKPPQSLFTLPRLQTLHVMSTTLDSASDILLLLIAFPQVSCLHLRELRPPLQSLLLHGPARLPANRNATSDSKICIREMSIASSTHPVPLWVLSVLRQPPFKCAFQKFVWGWSSDRAEETSFLGMVDEAKDTLEELTVHCAANSGLLETMDLSQHSLLKFLGVVLIRSQTVDLPTYKFPPTFLVFLSRTPNSLRALHVPIIQTLLSNGAPQWSFMDWPRFDETLALLHKRNPHLVVSIVLTLGLERGNKHWAPRVVKSLVVRPLLSRLHCSLLAGLHVRLVFGFVALVPKERPGFSVLVPKKPPKVCYLWKLEEFKDANTLV
ncbi:uncharacterized protein B0H18DRAFT_1005721 [Fomitopsis serialis]|uniref:uncharacterized protein n=1 Tax=Fomitopsis serialis TaxID=139415 RepID=UPI002007B564|nr:uncharacterized protein B0H18DRAFT_1005721 [Neoantrodia serialis]KAH9926814.1 hypothetical protein B0H18DRAFT_1005721 [Neoantrodia serialis]